MKLRSILLNSAGCSLYEEMASVLQNIYSRIVGVSCKLSIVLTAQHVFGISAQTA